MLRRNVAGQETVAIGRGRTRTRTETYADASERPHGHGVPCYVKGPVTHTQDTAWACLHARTSDIYMRMQHTRINIMTV